MSRCKLSFAKSRSVVDPARGTGAPEIPRNEAYRKYAAVTRDEGNAVLRLCSGP